MRIPSIPISEILHFIEVAAIVSAATFAGYQLRALRLQNSADFMLRLNKDMETSTDQDLSDALDSNPATPILKQHGGRFTVSQIDQYLGEFETLDDLYQNKLITCRMVYIEFSDDVENAYENKDVMNEVKYERKSESDAWEGFLHLGRQFDKNYHCQ